MHNVNFFFHKGNVILPMVKKSKKGLLETITNSIGTSLVLLTVSILGAVSLSYLCCKRGLFGSKQPKYVSNTYHRLVYIYYIYII